MPILTYREMLLRSGFDHNAGIILAEWNVYYWTPPQEDKYICRQLKWSSKLLDNTVYELQREDRLSDREVTLDLIAADPQYMYVINSYDGDYWLTRYPIDLSTVAKRSNESIIRRQKEWVSKRALLQQS